MPDHATDHARKLQKLGERIRDGFARQHPTSDKSLDTVRDTIREQWENDRAAKPQQPSAPTPARDRTKEGPDQER